AGAGLMEDVPSAHLSTRPRLLELLGAAGFEILRDEDISEHTRPSGRRSRAAFEDRRRQLTATFGAEAVARMARLAGQLAEADEHLGYVVITARTGSSGPVPGTVPAARRERAG
ncbi:hypothetical protein, partial [Streptomyces sp. B6B3]|uniref:hypothetical protein n=1 Tax=Streptomyces sp. B6B3 TaxID=3153570 RepID=UPI00325EDD0A